MHRLEHPPHAAGAEFVDNHILAENQRGQQPVHQGSGLVSSELLLPNQLLGQRLRIGRAAGGGKLRLHGLQLLCRQQPALGEQGAQLVAGKAGPGTTRRAPVRRRRRGGGHMFLRRRPDQPTHRLQPGNLFGQPLL